MNHTIFIMLHEIVDKEYSYVVIIMYGHVPT